MSTRSLGFKLEVLGNSATLNNLNQVKSKLDEVTAKIKELKKNKIGFSLDKKDLSDFLKALDKINTAKLSPAAIKQIEAFQKEIVKLKTDLEAANKKMAELQGPKISDESIKQGDNILKQLANSAKVAMVSLKDFRQVFDHLSTEDAQALLQKTEAIGLRLKEISKQKINIRADVQLTDPQKIELLAQLTAEEKALKGAVKEINTEIDNQTKSFEKIRANVPTDSIVALRQELIDLKKEYFNLSEAERNSAKGTEIQNKLVKVHGIVSEAEQSVGVFTRNVGNYKDAVLGLIPSLERLSAEGVIAQKDLINIFKGDLHSQFDTLQAEINTLAADYKKLGNEVENAGEKARLINELTVKTKQLENVSSQLHTTSNNFTRLGGSLLRVSDIITGGLIGGGILATISQLQAFGASSVQEFTQAEVAISKVNQQLKQTGNAAGLSGERLKQVSNELEVITGIDGDQILNDVTSSLLKFTNISGGIFERTQKLAIDLAQTLGGDLSGAANLLGKALSDPEKAIGRLAKQGVILDSATEKNLKQALKTNDTYKAQTIIIESLEKRFSGLGAAIQGSQLEQLRSLTVAWNNFKESIGRGIVGALNNVLTFIDDIRLGVNQFNNSTIELERGLLKYTDAVEKESTAIKSSFAILNDDNNSRKVKNQTISELVAKYPGLIDAIELEYASTERRKELEIELTNTVKQQIKERLKAQTLEAIETQKIQKALEVARVQSGQLTTGEQLAAGLSGRDSFIKNRSNQLTNDIKDLDKQGKILLQSFDNADKIINTALGITDNNIKKDTTNRNKAIAYYQKTLDQARSLAQNPNFSNEIRKQADDIAYNFENLNSKFLSSADNLENNNLLISKAQNEIKKLNKLTSVLPGDFAGNLTNDAKKTLEEQLKRIQDLDAQIKQAQADVITNEFQRKIAEVTAKADNEITALIAKNDKFKQDATTKLATGTTLNDKDKEELKKTNELIKLIQTNAEKAKNAIIQEQNEASRLALQQLKQSQAELFELTKQNISNAAQFDLENLKQTRDNQLTELKLGYDKDVSNLDEALAKKEISQKAYNKRVNDLELNFAKSSEKIVLDSSDSIINAIKKARLELDALTNARFEAQKLSLDNENANSRNNIISGTNPQLQIPLLIQQYQNYKANLNKINQDKISELEKNGQAEITAINQIESEKINITSTSAKKQSDNVKSSLKGTFKLTEDQLKDLKQKSIDLLQSATQTIFQINNLNAEKSYNLEVDRINKLYAKRIDAAKGNAIEQHKIEEERDRKLKALEKQQSERKKRAAISQAFIDGALGSLATLKLGLPQALPFLALAAAETALQIALIKRQSFAKGAYFNKGGQGGFTGAGQAPPDETGERPIGTGILHENEYIATRKQTSKDRLMWDIINKDRVRTNAGAKSTLDQDLYNHLTLKGIVHNLPLPQKKLTETFIPMLVGPSYYMKERPIKFSDESIDKMAEVIANKVAEKTGISTEAGTYKGMIKAAEIKERNKRIKLKSQI